MVTISCLLSRGWGPFWLRASPLFYPRLCVLTWYTYITAAGLIQCLLMGMMNGEARMRLEFMHCNGHGCVMPNTLVFQTFLSEPRHTLSQKMAHLSKSCSPWLCPPSGGTTTLLVVVILEEMLPLYRL
eukprot:scaffold212736_cov70-Cyclotella_meneghiniana.AAC.1